jgi:anti-anti-sigma regulatory factor
MNDRAHRGTTVVLLPTEIDVTNAEHAHDRLYAALADGVEVIADLSATAHGGQVERVVGLTGFDRVPDVYASVSEATAAA